MWNNMSATIWTNMHLASTVETGGRNERCISESNLFAVNGFNAKSKLSPSSGDNGAAGQATHNKYRVGYYTSRVWVLCETFNTKIVKWKKNMFLNFLNMYMVVSHRPNSPHLVWHYRGVAFYFEVLYHGTAQNLDSMFYTFSMVLRNFI